MDREILFKAKHEHVVVANKDLEGQWVEGLLWDEDYIYSKDLECEMLIDKIPFAPIRDCMTRTAKEYGKTIS